MTLLHATPGLLVGYALACAGVLAGQLWTHRPRASLAVAPLIAMPVALVGGGLAAWLPERVATAAGRPLASVLGVAALFVVGAVIGCGRPGRRVASRRIRGAHVTDGRLPRPFSDPHGIRLAGIDVPRADETKHFKLLGTTGTGKSTAIRTLLDTARRRGDRAVIADPDGAFAALFFDASRGDVLLNPFDGRSSRWDPFAELGNDPDADLLARALIADRPGEDRAWRTYARLFLAAVLRRLRSVDRAGVAMLHRCLTGDSVDDLRVLLDGTAVAPYLDPGNARFFASVRAIAISQLSAFDYLADPPDAAGVSVRAWVRGGGAVPAGSMLFFPYGAAQISTLGACIAAWMRLAIFEAMTLGEGDHRLWFVVDELDALGPIDGLKDALVRLRKYGGRCVLGMQSIAQVSGTYGASEAQTIVENCGNTLILRCSGSGPGGTARYASSLIGEREVLREQLSRSRGGLFEQPRRSRSVSYQQVTESAVLAAEIEQLPDLAGYLRLASADCWQRVSVPRS